MFLLSTKVGFGIQLSTIHDKNDLLKCDTINIFINCEWRDPPLCITNIPNHQFIRKEMVKVMRGM